MSGLARVSRNRRQTRTTRFATRRHAPRRSGNRRWRPAVEQSVVHASVARLRSLDGHVFRELANTFLDARRENWDGRAAHAVKDAVFVRAAEFLGQCLRQFPAPSSGATPDGALTLEWTAGPGRQFLVSIGNDDQIAFAGLFDSSAVQGSERFIEEVPPEIWEHLDHLFYA